MTNHQNLRKFVIHGMEKSILPITREEFDSIMEDLGPFGSNPVLAVALSGGADSMALTLLLNDWVQKHHGKLYAVSVDHGLRKESALEARTVHHWMKDLDIPHEILEWVGEKPKTHLQEKARKARYALLENYCREKQIFHLFLAHHMEDQAETFWLRVLKKSGIDGLAAMPAIQEGLFLRKIRPCLHISKSRLQATLEDLNQSHLKDPSNENVTFQRVKIRSQQGVFESLGLHPQVINHIVQKNILVKDALQYETCKALFHAVELSPLGYGILHLKALHPMSFEISRRVLERILMCIGRSDYPPRWASLIPILECLRSEGIGFSKRTLNHTLLKKRRDSLYVIPELVSGSEMDLNIERLLSGEDNFYMWQERFLIKFSKEKLRKNIYVNGRSLFLKPLGRKGRSLMKDQDIHGAVHPWEVLESLPSLWEGDRLLSIPQLKWGQEVWISMGFEEDIFFHPKVPLSP